MSIPCVAGPYTTVSCTLRLLRNSVRINTAMSDDGTYEHNNDEGVWTDDDRFRESNVGVKAIAASTAQHDSGMFELNFRDERYLPFEGAGAVSDWKIELTQDADLRLFDYSTISDVIVLVRYTAREDAGPFKDKVVSYLKAFLSNAAELSEQPLRRMFSLRHEFSTEWYKFLFPAVAGADQLLSLQFRKEHFPFFTQDKAIDVSQLQVMIQSKKTGDYKMMLTALDTSADPLVSTEITLPENPSYGNMQMTTLAGTTAGVDVESLDIYSPLTLKFKSNSAADYHSNATNPEDIEDIFIVVNYALGAS
jgi:hypothetical protein